MLIIFFTAYDPCAPIPHKTDEGFDARQPYSEAVKSDRRSGSLFSPEVSVPLQGEPKGA